MVNNTLKAKARRLFPTYYNTNQPVDMLIDTGAEVTIPQMKLIDNWSKENKPRITPVNAQLLGSMGDQAPFHGKSIVNIRIGNQIYGIPVYIAYIQQDGILRRNFFLSQKCELLLNDKSIKLHGDVIPYLHLEDHDKSCQIARIETIDIPPDTEVITMVEYYPALTPTRWAS